MEKRNHVARHAWQFNKPKVIDNKKKVEERKQTRRVRVFDMLMDA